MKGPTFGGMGNGPQNFNGGVCDKYTSVEAGFVHFDGRDTG